MIDAFSCLSIATAIAQFVDVAVKVVKKAREIQNSKGTTKEVSEFQENVDRFKSFSANLRDANTFSTPAATGTAAPLTLGATTYLPPDARALTDAANRCEKLSAEILTHLEKFQAPSQASRMSSFRVAFKVHMKGGELEEYERRLMSTKVDLSTILLQALGNKQASIFHLVEKLEAQDRKMSTQLSASLAEIKAQLGSINGRFQSSNITNVVETVSRLENGLQYTSKVQYLLSSFRFDAMYTRENSIFEKHADTFQWILSKDSIFVSWLRDSSGLFWISGKAGSGKSTLMKYLFESPGLRNHLKDWAGGNKLLISRHFFWNAGTSIQKSTQGLLRSLCYDIFKAYPSLLPKICRENWNPLSAAGCVYDSYREVWTESELFLIVKRLGEQDVQVDGHGIRLCFLIDGLDEFHGDHEQLNKAITKLAGFRNLKVCVSSRPWNVFKQSFLQLSETGCAISLQDFTKDDIQKFVQDRLETSPGFVRLLKDDARGSELVFEITTKANGVFLWVYLVINELSKSLTNHDDFLTIQRRLRQIPPGLEAFFKYMFDNLDHFYKQETARILRTAIVWPYKLPIAALAEVFPTEPLALRMLEQLETALDVKEVVKLESILETRMKGCCGDLLEVRDGKVQFLHRTVKDFLSGDEMTEELSTRAGPNFDVDIAICRMSIIILRYYGSNMLLRLSKRQSVATPVINTVRLQEPTAEVLVTFATHARKLELRTNRPPIDLYESLQRVAFDEENIRVLRNIVPDRMRYLACMNLAFELDRSIRAKQAPNPESVSTRWAEEALEYLVSDRSEPFAMSETILPQDLVRIAKEDDLDRRGFRLETITILLDHGAHPSKLWKWLLSSMRQSEDWTEYRRAELLQTTAHLFQAAAKRSDDYYLSEGEAKRLETLFGRSDAQWLLSLRKTTGWRFPLPLSWFGG